MGKAAGKQRSNRSLLLGIVVLLAGIAVLLYPYASNYLLEVQQMKAMNEQYEMVAETEDSELEAMLADARFYNERLYAGWGDLDSSQFPGYDELLNLTGNGVMGIIFIPAIDIEKPIYHGVDDEVLAKGVGHLPTTSLPVGGESTHAVITGHTGLPSGRFFDAIDRLKVGDWFVIECLGRDCAYEVESTEVVLPEQVSSLSIVPNRDLVTLVTCTPYGVNTHRLLVHGERIDLPTEWLAMKENGDAAVSVDFIAPRPLWPWALAGAGIACVIILVFVMRKRTRASKEEAVRDAEEVRK